MNLKDWLLHRRKQSVVKVSKDTVPGTVIPVDDLNAHIEFEEQMDSLAQSTETHESLPPCPLPLIMVCVCSQCIHAQTCPMERECRKEDCSSFIRACQNYTNNEDADAEDKRLIFKSGSSWHGSTFCFTPKGK